MRWLRLVAPVFLSPLLLACGPGPSEAPTEAAEASLEREAPHGDGTAVLEWLLEGNARFAEGRAVHPHEDLLRRSGLTDHQDPSAVVLGCADSRVPPELVFDVGLGDVFVIRVAGNVVADDEAGSIEYAVEHLGVPLVLVLGHEGCGAVTAALGEMDGEAPELSRLLRAVRPALHDVDPSLPFDERVHAGVEANVRHAVDRLRGIVERERDAHELPTGLRIVGGVYELESGRVRILE